MRYRFLFFILLVSLSACTFQTQIVTPETDLPTSMPQSFPVLTSTPFSESNPLTVTPPPFPTSTFAPKIIASSLPVDPNSVTYPIRFPLNATYLDVVDSLSAGVSKTYSVSAAKGQVMSVSINQSREGDWAYIPMRITGADGTILCPAQTDHECEFWRGTLPSTQEYFITITPATDALNFTLRVVIPPLSASKQTFLYQNDYAILSYTDEFAPARFHGAEVTKIAPELTLEFIDTNSYLNTNLLEVYFLFGSSSDGTLLQTCTQPVSLGGQENILGEENVNNIKFVYSKGGGVAAGNIYELTYYRAAYEGVCYEIMYFVHYGNIGAYSPELGVKEFDSLALMQTLRAVLSGIVIK